MVKQAEIRSQEPVDGGGTLSLAGCRSMCGCKRNSDVDGMERYTERGKIC